MLEKSSVRELLSERYSLHPRPWTSTWRMTADRCAGRVASPRAASLLTLTASSAIELASRSTLPEHRINASPKTLAHFRVHDVDTVAAELGTEVSRGSRPKELSIRALGLLTCEVLLEGAANDLTGCRVVLGARSSRALRMSEGSRTAVNPAGSSPSEGRPTRRRSRDGSSPASALPSASVARTRRT